MQLVAGIVSVRAVVKARSRTQLRTIKYLSLYTLTVGFVNLVGFLTAVVCYAWFVPLDHGLSIKSCTSDVYMPLVFNDTGNGVGFTILWYTSFIAFALSGVLTDGMLVSYL